MLCVFIPPKRKASVFSENWFLLSTELNTLYGVSIEPRMQRHSNVGILVRYLTKVGWSVRGEQDDMGK
jgi:hypothetical protein